MTPSLDEARLAAGCRAGDSRSLEVAFSLFDGLSAYTAGRAAEMIATAPLSTVEDTMGDWLARWPASPPAWYAARLLVERHGKMRKRYGERARDLLAVSRGAPAGVVLYALEIARIGAFLDDELVLQILEHGDPEVTLAGASLLTFRPFPEDTARRLANLRSPYRVAGLVLLLDAGNEVDETAVARGLRADDAHLFGVLDLLERREMRVALPHLERLWQKRFFVSPSSVRAASCAVRLGDAQALDALRAMGDRRRADVRGLALSELYRVGERSDAESVVARLNAESPSVRAHVASKLSVRSVAVAAAWLAENVEADADEDVRQACVEALLDWPEPLRVAEALKRIRESHPDKSIREYTLSGSFQRLK